MAWSLTTASSAGAHARPPASTDVIAFTGQACRRGGWGFLLPGAWLIGAIALAPLAQAADPAPEKLFLQPIINGVVAPGVVPVVVKPTGVRVAIRDLERIGISGKVGAPDGPGYRLIATTGPERCVINNQNQTVDIVLPAADLRPTVARVKDVNSGSAAQRAAIGAYANYYLTATTPITMASGQNAFTLTGNVNTVFFSGWGELLSNTAINEPMTEGSDQPAVARLSTTYEYDDPGRPMTVRVGDVITSAPGWARSDFMGGAQVASNYALQPTTITFPTPQVGGTLAAPSAVSLLVNNAEAYRSNLGAGPYAVVGIPVISGLNEITVQTRNANGQITSSTVPFYASTSMLKAGLDNYSVSLGYLRQNYGTVEDGYSIPAFDGTLSHGLTDHYTATLHAEASQDVQLLGLGIETTNFLGDFGLAASGSTSVQGMGGLLSAHYTRSTGRLSLSAGGTIALPGYNDLAAQNGTAFPGASWYVSTGWVLPARIGSVSLAYTEQSASLAAYDAPSNGIDSSAGGSHFLLISYSRQFWSGWSFSASASLGSVESSSGTIQSNGVNLSLSFPLGASPRGDLSFATGSGQRPQLGEGLSALSSAATGFGGQIQNQSGNYTSRSALVQANTLDANFAAQVSQFNGQAAGQLQANGSVALLDGLHFSAPISSAFAVLDVGYPKVPVYIENRPVGQTGSDGRAFVPGLLPYYANTISVDASALPLSANFKTDTLHVVPPLYGGVVAKLPRQKITGVMVHLQGGKGWFPPPGSLIYLRQSKEPIVVGFGGAAMIMDPPKRLEGYVLYPGGKCLVSSRVQVSMHNFLVGVTVPCVPSH